MIIPWNMINPDTLNNLIATFVSSEGTDNGDLSTLDDKICQVRRLLEEKKAVITFDHTSETFSIILKENISPAL